MLGVAEKGCVLEEMGAARARVYFKATDDQRARPRVAPHQ